MANPEGAYHRKALRSLLRRAALYLANLDTRKLLLWCALLWYLVAVLHPPLADGATWLAAAGVGLIVGTILVANAIPAGGSLRDLDRWTLFRFFLIPFCVSSFSVVGRARGFFLIFPPRLAENLLGIGACVVFLIFVFLARRRSRRPVPRSTKLR